MNHRSSGKARIPSAYAGGYQEHIKNRLESVDLPEKKIRMQSAYSKRQLDIIRSVIVYQGVQALGAGHAKCRACVGGQTVELRCSICEQVKSLDEFAKSQRQEHEFARCFQCVQQYVETEPVIDEQKLLIENDFSTVQDTMSQVDDASLGGPSRQIPMSSGDDDEDVSVAGGVWIEPERLSHSSDKGNGADLFGYDFRRGTNENLSVHSGWSSWAIKEASAVTPATLSKKKDSAFAKVPGYREERVGGVPRHLQLEAAGRAPPVDDEEEEEAGVEDFL
ncbi:hypothetical protein P175DRAFT_0559136 [Aspergillus ochraceoroseus IBT 24754]|uniref:Stc1 domain-containing protein n=2 Tax=Aspergillus ochraceoroseus TaxID=138278 RepID=A0A2T5LTG8_9EURO|nr:uncharacterized protein P175DRAFT_0559136 [Aspergillus ochraceoroseus IBT 24754]KKK21184.1 hypothetical protein AOCH_005128 [Aspergillus ochraceoroseus]PTU19576.1 hypothetical protein P175DRAFT_0559136 [Aspergillus ochraceoroseus IBT 24754]